MHILLRQSSAQVKVCVGGEGLSGFGLSQAPEQSKGTSRAYSLSMSLSGPTVAGSGGVRGCRKQSRPPPRESPPPVSRSLGWAAAEPRCLPLCPPTMAAL